MKQDHPKNHLNSTQSNKRNSSLKQLLFSFGLLLSLGFVHSQVLQRTYPNFTADVPLELALLQETNKARAANGLAALQADETLAIASRAHAQEMVELNYFAHQSPVPANRNPNMRVANAGSPLVFSGENIAKMPPGNIAIRTTEGWMNSPGHRENMLEPTYTHVGYGTAQDAQGLTYVVQTLAYQPFKLISANAQTRVQTAYEVVFNARASLDTEAVFSYGPENSQPTQIKKGDNPISYLTLETQRLHLQGSVLAPEGGGYIIQDGGWLDLAAATYLPDDFSTREALALESISVRPKQQNVSDIALQFDGVRDPNLAVFVNSEFQPNAVINSGVLRLSLPQTGQSSIIGIGERIEGNRFRITHQVQVETLAGQVILKASSER